MSIHSTHTHTHTHTHTQDLIHDVGRGLVLLDERGDVVSQRGFLFAEVLDQLFLDPRPHLALGNLILVTKTKQQTR